VIVGKYKPLHSLANGLFNRTGSLPFSYQISNSLFWTGCWNRNRAMHCESQTVQCDRQLGATFPAEEPTAAATFQSHTLFHHASMTNDHPCTTPSFITSRSLGSQKYALGDPCGLYNLDHARGDSLQVRCINYNLQKQGIVSNISVIIHFGERTKHGTPTCNIGFSSWSLKR